jgi:hypothetical protein
MPARFNCLLHIFRIFIWTKTSLRTKFKKDQLHTPDTRKKIIRKRKWKMSQNPYNYVSRPSKQVKVDIFLEFKIKRGLQQLGLSDHVKGPLQNLPCTQKALLLQDMSKRYTKQKSTKSKYD